MHVSKIAQWGNSAALRLSADVLKEARLKIGSTVSIEITKEGVLLKPEVGPKRYSLDEMLAACDLNAPMPADLTNWGKAPIAGAELL